MFMKRKKYLNVLLIFVLISMTLLSACNKKLPGKTGDVLENEPTTEPVSSFEIPTPSSEFAVVHGRIIKEGTNKAPENSVFLAANITAGQPDLPVYFSFSHVTSPQAKVDDNGFFYFQNVPEGQYVILLFVPGGNPIFIDNGKTDDTMDYLWVNAVANETLDMGTIVVP